VTRQKHHGRRIWWRTAVYLIAAVKRQEKARDKIYHFRGSVEHLRLSLEN
jgi:hypothetical protein